jgi:hypothetical protein
MDIVERRVGTLLATDPAGKGACFTFSFCADGEKIFGRRYEAALHRAEILHRRDRSDKIRYFRNIPYHNLLFRQAVRHFFEAVGVREVQVMLVRGALAQATFEPVDPAKITDPDVSRSPG